MNRKPKHILFLSSWYPSRIFPTNGDFVQRHAEASSEFIKVSNIHVVTDPSLRENQLVEKINNGNLNSYIVCIKEYQNPARKYRAFLQAFKLVYKEIENVDFVHVNVTFPAGLFALYLKRKFNIPYLVTEHWTGYHTPKNKAIGLMQKVLTRRICKNASKICPVSSQLAHSMKDFGLKGNYSPIPNIVDTDLFVPIKMEQKKTSDKFKILHVSNMKDVHKNVSGILRVAAKLKREGKDIEIILVGGNPLVFEGLIKSLSLDKDTVKTLAQVSQKELVSHYQEADVFVLFSNYENLPCVILEAFSCGLPVISSNVGGIEEYFPNDFGSLIPAGDEDALYDQLSVFLHRKIEVDKAKMHQYAVDNFGKSTVINQYLELYNSIN